MDFQVAVGESFLMETLWYSGYQIIDTEINSDKANKELWSTA